MDYPTFGGADRKLQLCVKSLDRKGELTKMNDRHKVLINRAPKRHRSITAMNFFASPPPSDCPPVPALPPVAATKRPPPRFLEVFTPLCDTEDNSNLAPSNVSTPSTHASSIPVTPSSPRQELHGHKGARSYFLLFPVHHHESNPALMNDTPAIPQPLRCSDVLPDDSEGVAEEWQQEQGDQQKQRDVLNESTRSDRSIVWPEHGNALMMDGTFGRM